MIKQILEPVSFQVGDYSQAQDRFLSSVTMRRRRRRIGFIKAIQSNYETWTNKVKQSYSFNFAAKLLRLKVKAPMAWVIRLNVEKKFQ